MVTTISIRELRPKLSNVINDIHKKFDRYVVTKHGKPEVMMMSVEDYESMIETFEIRSDKELMKSIAKAKKELKQGKGIPYEQAIRRITGV